MRHQEYDEYAPETKSIATTLQARFTRPTKHQYEYQEICENLQKDFGKLVWTLPYKKGVTEYKIKKAGEIARARGILDYRYLVGIIKKL